MKASTLLLLMRSATYNYLLNDQFTNAQAAPIANPRNAEPGPGVWTITDPNSHLSIASAALRIQGASGAYTDPLVVSGAYTRTVGRALLFKFMVTSGSQWLVGWADSTSNGTASAKHSFFAGAALSSGIFYWFGTGTTVALTPALTNSVWYEVAIVLRGTGALFFLRGGTEFPIWALLQVDKLISTSPMYVTSRNSTLLTDAYLDDVRVIDLGLLDGRFLTDLGMAYTYLATSAANSVINTPVNGAVEHTIVAATGITQEIAVRYTDASNCWVIRMTPTGSTIKIFEEAASVETQRATASQTWTNGTTYKVVVYFDGTTISANVNNVSKVTYASASSSQTATQATVNRAGTDLASYDKNMSLPIV